MFEERLHSIRERIAEAAIRTGRRPEDVRLLAVTKGVGMDAIREAMDLGQTLFGENYVQEAVAREKAMGGYFRRLTWHFIGHLQTNKARRACELFDCIETVDCRRLLDAICRAATPGFPVYVQVNLGREPQKAGILPEDLRRFVEETAGLSQVRIAGLMAIPPYSEDPESTRGFFRRLRELRDELNETLMKGRQISELSMGMSHDFEVAIEEGATIVRVGTALFGPRNAR